MRSRITRAILDKGATHEWGTPDQIFDALNEELGPFVLDAAAANAEVAKVSTFISPEQDALKTPWLPKCAAPGPVWLNPPFDLNRQFMEAAVENCRTLGVVVVCIIPVRSCTRWWHDWVFTHADEVRFIKSRVHYVNLETGQSDGPSGYPSCIAIFRPETIDEVGMPRFERADSSGRRVTPEGNLSGWLE